MKKRFSAYVVFWAALLILFNIIAFVSPGWIWFEKYDSAFWIGYVAITVTFFGQLACAWFALKENNAQKLFYKLPLITTSYTGLIVTFLVGGLCMLISPLPYWVGILVCSVVLGLNVLSVAKAVAAVEEIARVDEKVQHQTFFIKSLTVDAEALMAWAKSDAVKTECKKVYEAVRYSDPMSSGELAAAEASITQAFSKFSDAVKANSLERVAELANEVCLLIEERNKKCKLLK